MSKHQPSDAWEAAVPTERDPITTTLGEEAEPTVDVVRAVATATDTAPRALRPLSEAIDPTVLIRVFESGDAEAVLSFTYEGCRVCLAGDGRLAVASL